VTETSYAALDASTLTVTPAQGSDVTRAIGTVTNESAVPTTDCSKASPLNECTRWRQRVGAAEAAGIAGWCVDTATAYAKTREQFGRTIGSFQAIKNLCADIAGPRGARLGQRRGTRASVNDGDEHQLALRSPRFVALETGRRQRQGTASRFSVASATRGSTTHISISRRAWTLRQLLGDQPVAQPRGRTWRRRRYAVI